MVGTVETFLMVERHEGSVTRVETAVNRPYVPLADTTVTARVDVEPGDETGAVERHVALCIDTSGSMTGEKMARARDGLEWVFGLLEPADRVAVVGYDSEAEVVLEPARWGDVDAETARECVTSITPGGGTNSFEGIRRAREALEAIDRDADSDGRTPVRQILLVSDGKDRQHDRPAFEDLAAGVDDAGIRIHAGGIGDSYDEDTIRALGRGARGEWAHLEDPGDIEAFVGEAVERAGSVVAPEARLTFDLAPGVELDDVYRAVPQAQQADPDRENGTVTVGLPDLVAGQRQRVVAKLGVPPGEADEEPVALADVTLAAEGARASDSITVTYTGERSKLATSETAVQLAHEEAVHRSKLGRGDLAAAARRVERMTTIAHEDADEVRAAKRRMERVRDGGRAARNRATRLEAGHRTCG